MQTVDAFDKQFPNDDACRRFLAEMRWPDGVHCPRCDNNRVYKLSQSWKWQCKICNKNGYRFSVITGTIFQDTKIPLKLWFKVGYLMLVSKKGVSALQIHRVIFGEDSGSDYRTSWYMCHRWRAAMKNEEFDQLVGEVEVDETFVGGKAKNRHGGRSGAGRGTAGKVAVIGAIVRKGNIVAKVIENTDTKTLDSFVKETVSDKVSLVATDEHSGYAKLSQEGYPHESVKHGQGEYVRGNVHTANIDGFWSLLKRGIMGSFHHVSKDYLPLYVNEFAFRHNNRKNPHAFADLIGTCGK